MNVIRKSGVVLTLLLTAAALSAVVRAADIPDPERDILVTFDNQDARATGGGLTAPYLHRKRYSIARSVRRDAAAVEREHSLKKVDHWPIKSLSIYCYVFRIPEGANRKQVIARLNADARVETAQPLQSFETGMEQTASYDDEYANLQYGLDVLDVAAAHVESKGAGIRVAIVDSHADKNHEDLKGRIERIHVFANKAEQADRNHGTAVASIIGARSNNSLGIVGVAPEAELELYVSCWKGVAGGPAICDSFSLSKALDTMLEDPPHVLNLSLVGPHDPLLERLLRKLLAAGVVVVAAGPSSNAPQKNFPSSMRDVISVSSMPSIDAAERNSSTMIFAPGERILVAVPANDYDFRSGSSLAAAHISGVVALLLHVVPNHAPASIRDILRRSQMRPSGGAVSVNACDALNLSGLEILCSDRALQSKRNAYR